MSLKLNYQLTSRERENFEGKKERILILNCKKCVSAELSEFNRKKCIRCILKSLNSLQDTNFNYLSLGISNAEIPFFRCTPILEYFKKLKKIKSVIEKIQNLRKKKCDLKTFQCKIFTNDYLDFSLSDDQYIDPIYVYNLISAKLDNYKINTKLESYCVRCERSLRYSLKALLKILKELKIVKEYIQFQKRIKNSTVNSNFYEKYFFSFEFGINELRYPKEIQRQYEENLIDEYNIGPHNLFKILIYKIPNEFEKLYNVKFAFESELEEIYHSKIINDISRNLELLNVDKIISLEDLIEIYEQKAIEYINSKYKFSKEKVKKLALLTTLQKLNIHKLFPFLVDDNVEEIFLDSPIDTIYIDHQKFGRCRTKTGFSSIELERIKTLIRLYSGKAIDYANPSIKLVLNNKFFYCRFAVDTEPISLNKFSLDIRKLNKNIFTIQDLLKNKTLSPNIAAYLYFNITRRTNLTVTGETNTGKTTLINALDLLIPKEFRKIYVESITESLNQSSYERHQLKYKVDSQENTFKQKFSKQNQIKKLLHRTPDIIYLGEILTKGEANAMFHCLAAGLRGFQTIHSNDLDSLINRFLFHFK
ncbi:MAG: ATPase, T2SS/T4P/T4SS family, partial [Candidatus Hodarchaeota archaeon]